MAANTDTTDPQQICTALVVSSPRKAAKLRINDKPLMLQDDCWTFLVPEDAVCSVPKGPNNVASIAVISDGDLLTLILSDFTTAAPAISVCKQWAAVARPVVHATNPLKALAGEPTITQGNLEAALLLPANVVRSIPYEVRHRFGGGEYHIFETEPSVNRLLSRTGWLTGLAARMVLKERRAARKRRREALDTGAGHPGFAVLECVKGSELAKRRSAALAERRAAFAAARASAVHVRTEADLCALVPASELGNVFGLVLKSCPTIAAVCRMSVELEIKCAARAARKEAFEAARAGAVYVKRLCDLPGHAVGDFDALTETPMTTLADVLSAAEAAELQRLVCAGRKHHSSRACTYPGCGNQHRAANPLIAASGPVCGRCAKFV